MGTTPSKPAPTAPSAVAIFDEKKAAALEFSYRESDGAAGWSSVPVDSLSKWSDDIDASPTLQLSRLVLTNADPLSTFTSRKALLDDGKVFNLNLKGIGAKGAYPNPRVNQAASGRCWLFATCNVLRYNVMDLLKLEEFELAQSYLFFYDKLEKANYYLE